MTEDDIRVQIQSAFELYLRFNISGVVEKLRESYSKDPPVFEDNLREMLSSNDLPDLHYWLDVAGTERLSDSFFNLGVLYADQDIDDQAVKCFAQSAAMGLSAGLVSAGELLVWHGQFAEAEPYLLRARGDLNNTDDGRRAAALLGIVYFERDGRSDDEVLELLSAPGLEGDTFSYTLAKATNARGDHEHAREMFERLLASGDARAALDLGNMFWEADEIDLAESVYREGMKLGNWRCIYNLGSMFLDVGRRVEGLQFVKEAAQRGDDKAIARLLELPK